jgi:polyphosphate kinase
VSRTRSNQRRPRVVALAEARGASASRPGESRFFNRDLSWLDFDQRVLEFASDKRLPLLERVRLCGIVSSNLDEFFGVRLAQLEMEVSAGTAHRTPDGRTAAEILAEAGAKIRALTTEQDALWLNDLQPALASNGIELLPVGASGTRAVRTLRRLFEREILPRLTPIALGPSAPSLRVASLALNLALLATSESGPARLVRLTVPEGMPRFLPAGAGLLATAEDVIEHFAPSFLGYTGVEACVRFRVTRSAELSLPRDASDLLEAVESQVAQRRFGRPVRLEVNAGAPTPAWESLRRTLGLQRRQVYERRAPLALEHLTDLAALDRAALKSVPWRPVTRKALANGHSADLLSRIRKRDLLVHHPYDSFESSVQAFVSAARDPSVVGLKATVYRTDDTSPTLLSLIESAGADKQAVAVVELQARFDERRNVEWARELERAGVEVVWGVPDLKVHAKLALLTRVEDGLIRRYVHIGTGNYHASNASTYEDLSLFTADDDIAADVGQVFNAVTGDAPPPAFRKLLVGPWFLREGVLREVAAVRDAARRGETARIRIKVNSLVDPDIIDALYEASGAGVTIEIVTRGICSLRPGVRGLSERIVVKSVLGRFLEHSRILSFEAGGRNRVWIGSADLMPRNLDRRVEVLAPVEDQRLRAEIQGVLDLLLADSASSWQLGADGSWRRTDAYSLRAVSAQEALMARALRRSPGSSTVGSRAERDRRAA